jgi:hypothetical protein
MSAYLADTVDIDQTDGRGEPLVALHTVQTDEPPLVLEKIVSTSIEVPVTALPHGAVRWVDTAGHDVSHVADASVAGIRVSLRNADDDEVARTITDDRGGYEFDELPIGDYSVVFTVPSGATAVPIGTTGVDEQARLREAMMAHDRLEPTPIHTYQAATAASAVGAGDPVGAHRAFRPSGGGDLGSEHLRLTGSLR